MAIFTPRRLKAFPSGTNLFKGFEMLELELIQTRVNALLEQRGPLLGKELAQALPDVSRLNLWQACFTSPSLQISHFATYYLRYDITREDYVRLSPSILRDFLSFTLLSLPSQRRDAVQRQGGISNTHREISLEKIAIARRVWNGVLKMFPSETKRHLCAFIAGDLAYFLAHNEPREVQSIGEMVMGSDIDIIIIHDALPKSITEMIDHEMMRQKSYYLRHPQHRQEIDFICKSKSTMFKQFSYGDIHQKIASKIAYESMFLGGSLELYMSIRDGLVSSGVQELIEGDFRSALVERNAATVALLAVDDVSLDDNTKSLFFFSQERVEFS